MCWVFILLQPYVSASVLRRCWLGCEPHKSGPRNNLNIVCRAAPINTSGVLVLSHRYHQVKCLMLKCCDNLLRGFDVEVNWFSAIAVRPCASKLPMVCRTVDRSATSAGTCWTAAQPNCRQVSETVSVLAACVCVCVRVCRLIPLEGITL